MKHTPLETTADLSQAGGVFCSDDSTTRHHSSCSQFPNTIAAYIAELTHEDRVARKTKTILKRQRHQASWKQPEVDQLVLLLRRYGSDFATIAIQLNKERDQVKRKFKVLEKTHPHLAASIFEKSEVALHHDDYNQFLE